MNLVLNPSRNAACFDFIFIQVVYLIGNDKTFNVDLPYKVPSKFVFWETKYTTGQRIPYIYETTLFNFVKTV